MSTKDTSTIVAEIVAYLRERADVVQALDGMYGIINAANQLRWEACRIEEKFGGGNDDDKEQEP